MKKAQLAEVIVGLVFVAGVSLLGLYTIVITKVTLGSTKNYKVFFSEVYGLKEGDPVRVEGFEVGEVASLRPLPEGGIMAVLRVSDDVQIYRAGSEVRVTPFSPLGGRVVEIERGKAASKETYSWFGKAEGHLDEDKADTIQGVAEGELLQTLNQLVEQNRDSVRRIVQNLETVSNQLTKTDNILGYLINSTEGQERISGVVDGMSSAFGSASNILERADEGRSAVGVLVSDRPDLADATQGIVSDVKVITGRVAAGEGTIGKLVHDDRLYEGAASTAENLAVLTKNVNEGHGVIGVLSEEKAGNDVRSILDHGASIASAVDDPEAGTLGLVIHDDVLRGRVSRIVTEVERLVVEFRDSLEDAREQAPVNAFIGAVFAAF